VKLRNPRILIKRRTFEPIAALDHLKTVVSVQGWSGEWFHRRLLLRQLRAVCQVP
jgi:hypothetical protein